MRLRVLLASGIAVAALVAIPLAASAHAVIIAGGYHVAIGWQFEPPGTTSTYVDYPNAVQVFVDTATASDDIGSPVTDLNADCTKPDIQVTVTFGSTTSSPMCPGPAFDSDTGLGRSDEYDVTLIPTRVGNYTFHIYGSIHGTPIDKTVTSSSSTFDSVGDQSAVQFPAAAPALSDVSTKVDALGSRADTAQSAASSASDGANRAGLLAIIAIVVAVVLGGANLAVLLRRRRI